MSSYRNDSTAYDLNMFDPAVKSGATRDTMVVAHNRKSVYARKNAASNIVLAIIISALFVVLIGSHSTLNELTTQVSSAKKEYTALLEESDKLSVQLESKINLAAIEETAINTYGMVKADQDDIQYISLMGEDEAEVLKDENAIETFFSNLFVDISFYK